MKVYVIVQETLSWWDNDFFTNVHVFKDRQSALNFLKLLKDSTIEELMDDFKYDTIDDLNADCDCFEIEDEDFMSIRLEEWGTENIYHRRRCNGNELIWRY